MSEQSPPPAKKFNTPKLVVTVGLASVALAISGWLYLSNGTAQAKECPVQAAKAKIIDSAAVGELAALNGTGEGRGYKNTAFKDANGQDLTIADFKGQALLVNFWASWCVPCREEMPALDELAASYNSEKFMVLPINLDIGDEGVKKAQNFMDEEKLSHLPIYADSSFAAFKKLQTDAVAIGLPTTLILDENGCELAVLQGPAAWSSPDGQAVIKTLLGLTG